MSFLVFDSMLVENHIGIRQTKQPRRTKVEQINGKESEGDKHLITCLGLISDIRQTSAPIFFENSAGNLLYSIYSSRNWRIKRIIAVAARQLNCKKEPDLGATD